MTAEQEYALHKLEQARMDLRNAENAKNAGKYEGLYGTAYQHCVALGIKPQIRAKYRPFN